MTHKKPADHGDGSQTNAPEGTSNEPSATKARAYEGIEVIKKERLKYASAILTLTMGLLGVIFGWFQLGISRRDDTVKTVNDIVDLSHGISQDVESLNKAYADKVAEFNAAVRAASTNKPTDAETALLAKQEQLDATVQQMDKRLTAMEKAVLDSPEKSLAIPLMRKDLDDSDKRLDEYNLSVKADLDRLYEQQKTMVIAIMGALATVAGTCITIILKSAFGNKDSDKPGKLASAEAD